MAIRMTEISVRKEHIAHALLQLFRLREAPIGLALPDHMIINRNLEFSAMVRPQGDLREVFSESLQHFLREPGSPQQPMTLRAIIDGHVTCFRRLHHDLSLNRAKAMPWEDDDSALRLQLYYAQKYP